MERIPPDPFNYIYIAAEIWLEAAENYNHSFTYIYNNIRSDFEIQVIITVKLLVIPLSQGTMSDYRADKYSTGDIRVYGINTNTCMYSDEFSLTSSLAVFSEYAAVT